MATVSIQPDSQTKVQKYITYLDGDDCAFRGYCATSNTIYTPRSNLSQYFARDGNSVEDLLKEVLEEKAHGIPEERLIFDSYLVVFTILLAIRKAQYLPHFIERNYTDESLPFFDKPRHFPKTHPTFFRVFSDAQWRFCPVKLHKNTLTFELEPEQILPVSEKHEIVEYKTSRTYRAQLHSDYDLLAGHQDEELNDFRTSRTQYPAYLFREFTDPSKTAFDRELEMLISLRKSSQSLSRIVNSFYGSFTQDGILTIVLAYAEHGSLDEYMFSISPPTENASIARLWESLLSLHEALYISSNSSPASAQEAGLPWLSQCCYRSLHPARIGVFRGLNKAEYSHEFRLIGFGIPNEFEDNEACAAPECSHATSPKHIDMPAANTWSLGCVLSEFAVWITLGLSGLQGYRSSRSKACKNIDTHGIAPFHDQHLLLKCVPVWHNWSVSGKPSDDNVTALVLQNLVDNMLCNDKRERLNPHQIKLKIAKLLRKAQDPNPTFEERSESRSSGDTAVSSVARSSDSHESERPLLQNTCHRRSMSATSNEKSIAPPQTRLLRPTPRPRAEVQATRDPRPFSFVSSVVISKPLPKTSRDDLRPSKNKRDSTTAPEVVPFQLQSAMSSLEHSSTSSTLVNGDDKEVFISVAPAATPRSPASITLDQFGRNMSSSSQGLTAYTPSLSLQEGLTWLSTRKGSNSNTTLRDESYLDDLAGRDFYFLVDNSLSMRAHRDLTARAVRLLSWLLKKYDKHGIELHFTRKFKHEYARQGHSSDLQKPLLKRLEEGEGQSDISKTLTSIVQLFRDRALPEINDRAITNTLERGSKFVSAANKIMIYVITDGNWKSGSEGRLEAEMHAMAKPLKMQGEVENAVGIQFLRVEENSSVVAKLNRLKKRSFADRIKIDSQPLEGNVFRSLLGPITDIWDDESEDR